MNQVPSLPASLPDVSRFSQSWTSWNKIQAVAGVVIREIYRRKDFYVLFIITALLTVALGSANFFGEDKTVRYLKEICLLLIWISSLVIIITTTARQIPSEREHRTLFPLLAKPVTRYQLILGKFFGCWLASGLALVVFYTFFAVISGAREHHWPLLGYFQAVTLHWFMLGVVCSLSLLGSLIFAAPSSNNTITFVVVAGILFFGRELNKVATQLSEPGQTIVYALYYLLPHLELFDVRKLLIHNWPAIGTVFWLAALGYAAVYTTLFLLASCLIFRRRAVN